MLASCGLIEDDALPPCPQGIDLYFRYDRNLQRANMFPDHVGGLTVYIYDADGRFIRQQSDAKAEVLSPFQTEGYHMHLELPVGQYRLVVLANQKDYASTLLTPGAKQRVKEPQVGDPITDLRVSLDHSATPVYSDTAPLSLRAAADGDDNSTAPGEPIYRVDNHAAPLDTLWLGYVPRDSVNRYTASARLDSIISVPFEGVVRHTAYLTRDTKQINVTLRDVELPSDIDVNDYDFRITDHNSAILYDNAVDESVALLYTPFATWNTTDIVDPDHPVQQPDGTVNPGSIGHADFMTSRIIYHDASTTDHAVDAQLIVTHRPSGREIIRVNLADLLSRLRTSADRYYTPQEFLDRGYDYRLTFFLQGNRWKYVNVEISNLSWARRFQAEDL